MTDARNPIATADQAAVEKKALLIQQHPIVQKARAEVRQHWLDVVKPSADGLKCFEESFNEVMFCAAVWSLNQDPQRPLVTTITRLAHQLDGVTIPGSRYGLDNPDSVYRTIPIDGAERYEIRGKVAPRRLVENYFTLWDHDGNTVDVLNGSKLQLEADGSFVITVDSDPANGRPNHVQSSPKAHQFYIRDVLLDWNLDTPNTFSIVRLGAPPTTPPISDDEQAKLTAKFMRDYADNTVRWNAQALNRPPNVIDFTIDRDTDGALRNQFYVLGHFQLQDDEALVLSLQTAGANYFIVPITNVWGTSNEIVHRTGCLNKSQSAADADGNYTFVVSLRDPGIHNWVDPTDMHEGIITARWAEFPDGRPTGKVALEARLVKFADLERELPAGTVRVTPAQRREQLQKRAEGYLRRLAE
jgi:hypothetical protein